MNTLSPLPAARKFLVTAGLLTLAVRNDAAVLVSVTDNGGNWTYSYTVDNTVGGFDIALWSLELPVLPDWNQDDTGGGGDVAVPSLWLAGPGVPLLGVAAQDFISLDPTADVAVGSVLSGYSFTSALGPGSVTYFEYDPLGSTAASGLTVGPVPEPQAAALAGAFVLLLGALCRRFAWRKT